MGFPCGSAREESTCNAGDLGSVLGLGRSPEEGKGYPLQYSGLENSMDWIIHAVTKSWTQMSNFHSMNRLYFCSSIPDFLVTSITWKLITTFTVSLRDIIPNNWRFVSYIRFERAHSWSVFVTSQLKIMLCPKYNVRLLLSWHDFYLQQRCLKFIWSHTAVYLHLV